jgi:sugar lactone lactonase YvrE
MGMWTDSGGNVFVAIHAERAVVRVGADGKVTVAARTTAPWSPTGGMIDRDGSLWLLEGHGANEVRVRRLDREGRERVF